VPVSRLFLSAVAVEAIAAQTLRSYGGCAEGLSIVHFNKKKMNQWIKDFPGALNDTGDIPRIRRDRYDCLIRSEDD